MAKKKKGKRVYKDQETLAHEITILVGKGESWTGACNRVGISRSYGYDLRRKNPDFDAEIKRLLASPLHRQRLLMEKGRAEAASEDDWRQQFIAQYRITEDKAMAADAVGKTPLEIEHMVTPDHEEYDEELAALMEDQEMRIAWGLETAALRTATKGGNTAMQQFLLKSLRKDKFGTVGDKNAANKTLNVFWFSREQERDAMKFIESTLVDEPTSDLSGLLEA